VNNLKSTLIN